MMTNRTENESMDFRNNTHNVFFSNCCKLIFFQQPTRRRAPSKDTRKSLTPVLHKYEHRAKVFEILLTFGAWSGAKLSTSCRFRFWGGKISTSIVRCARKKSTSISSPNSASIQPRTSFSKFGVGMSFPISKNEPI